MLPNEQLLHFFAIMATYLRGTRTPDLRPNFAGFSLVIDEDFGASDDTSPVFGVYVQYSNTAGTIEDYFSWTRGQHTGVTLMDPGAEHGKGTGTGTGGFSWQRAGCQKV